MFLCLLDHAYEVLLANIKVERQKSPKAFNMGEDWNPVGCHDNRTVKVLSWSTFSITLVEPWYQTFLLQIG